MVLACEQPLTGYHETNFSMAYSSHISWESADSPVPTEVYLMGMPHLAENLEAGLDAMGVDVGGAEEDFL